MWRVKSVAYPQAPALNRFDWRTQQIKQLLNTYLIHIHIFICLALLGFGPGVQPAAATSPTKRPLSPDHPNPALPITEVSTQSVRVKMCVCACVSTINHKGTHTHVAAAERLHLTWQIS